MIYTVVEKYKILLSWMYSKFNWFYSEFNWVYSEFIDYTPSSTEYTLSITECTLSLTECNINSRFTLNILTFTRVYSEYYLHSEFMWSGGVRGYDNPVLSLLHEIRTLNIDSLPPTRQPTSVFHPTFSTVAAPFSLPRCRGGSLVVNLQGESWSTTNFQCVNASFTIYDWIWDCRGLPSTPWPLYSTIIPEYIPA